MKSIFHIDMNANWTSRTCHFTQILQSCIRHLEIYIWEHLGMLDDMKYFENALERIRKHQEASERIKKEQKESERIRKNHKELETHQSNLRSVHKTVTLKK